MYTIHFHYYQRVPHSTDPIGMPIKDTVKGETLAELNKAYQRKVEMHDVFYYLPMVFDKITQSP